MPIPERGGTKKGINPSRGLLAVFLLLAGAFFIYLGRQSYFDGDPVPDLFFGIQMIGLEIILMIMGIFLVLRIYRSSPRKSELLHSVL